MVKVIHIINNLDRGGAETLLLNIIKGLKTISEEHDIRVLILEDKQHLTPQFHECNIPVDLVECLNKSAVQAIWDIVKYLKVEKPDYVHTHLLSADKIGLPAAFLAGVRKRICSVHNMEQNRNSTDKKSRIVARLFAQKFIAVSQSAKDFCVKNKLYPKNKIDVIYNVPGFQIKEQIPISKRDTMSAINVARLHKQKGQEYLIAAFKILKDRGIDCLLSIYGVGKEKQNLERVIKNNCLTNVLLKGQSDEIANKLRENSFFIASSLWEGFNMAMVEALSVGLPVIATNIPPHVEILTQFGDYPFLVDPEDPCQIADKVEMIVNMDSNEYLKFSKLAINLSKKFSYNKMIKSYLALYP